jgi:hypothetical protein
MRCPCCNADPCRCEEYERADREIEDEAQNHPTLIDEDDLDAR